jgi:dihydrofolate reductase
MGTTVYWMNVSMDLRIEHAPGEQGGGSWMRIGDELHRAFNERAKQLKLMIQGRVIHETMESFWPNAATDATLPDYLQEYGRIWLATPKVLVSNTRREAEHNTRVIGGPDVLARLAALRRETDGTIGVGGATLATELLRNGLLDEVLLFIHPVILGSGRPLFDDGSHLVHCELLEQATFEGGVVMHRYSVARPGGGANS